MRACWRSQSLIAARRAGLSEADRLWLEAHLEGCAACRQEAHLMGGLAAVADTGLARIVLSDRAVARAVTGALRDGASDTGRLRAIQPARRWPVFALGGGLVAAAVALVLVLRGGDAAPGTRTAPAPVVASTPAATLPAATPSQALPAGRATDLTVARIVLSKDGEARWDEPSRTVELRAGRADLDVTPARTQPFTVRTERFQVVVVGTAFSVTPQSVEVVHGTVRVLTPTGEPLVEALSAGGRWHVAEATASLEPGEAPEVVPPAPAGRDDRPTTHRPRGAAAVDLGVLLADARRALARGDGAGARRLVEQALGGKPSRAERAEAETLLAECALVDGDVAGAAAQYARVAERYADLPAGETALYAAASASARAGRTAAARELAARYLERYPDGRLRADAEALLARTR